MKNINPNKTITMEKNPNFTEVYKLPLHADQYAPSMVWTADGYSAFDFVTGTKDNVEWDELITVKTANQYLNVINGKKKSNFTQKFVYENSYIYYTENDGKLYPVISIRGYGYLTSPGGLNLDSTVAVKIQDDFGKYIVEKLNENQN